MGDVSESQKFEQVFQALITVEFDQKDVQTFYYLMKQCVSLYRFFSQIQSEENFLKEDSLYGVYFGEIILRDASDAVVKKQNRELLASLKIVAEKVPEFGELMSEKDKAKLDNEKYQSLVIINTMAYNTMEFFQAIYYGSCSNELTIPVNLIFMECDAMFPQKDERKTSEIFAQIEYAIDLLKGFVKVMDEEQSSYGKSCDDA